MAAGSGRLTTTKRVALALVAAAAAIVFDPPRASAIALLPGFRESAVFTGLTLPVSVRFAPDGRAFVAEKGGRIKVFDSVADSTADVLVDLSGAVYGTADRGLLGLALDPRWPSHPFVYALYSYDANPDGSGVVPRWGDVCPSPPGANSSGCIVTARLSRFEVSPTNTLVGAEQVLIEGGYRWCEQFPSHSIGDLRVGPDGALYVSAGDGASYDNVDFGQFGGTGGVPVNPCGDPDPPTHVGVAPANLATAQGGALRSQDLVIPGDGVSFDGAILRVDPDTGDALPSNPLYGGAASDDDRIIAFGLRNPYRFAVRPGTSELWIGDVGWNSWEEVNRILDPTDGIVENFGWPCYEGHARQPGYDGIDNIVCETLYANPTMGASPALQLTAPLFAWNHAVEIVPGDGCLNGAQAASIGGAFYTGTHYPGSYANAYFFGDYSRRCLYAMQADANGVPDPSRIVRFGAEAYGTIALESGPGGDLYRVSISGGEVTRISYRGPTAQIVASPGSGPAPLVVQFDGSTSTSQVPGVLDFAWDLDGDGEYDDSSLLAPLWTYTAPGSFAARLRVTDAQGAVDATQATINVSNTAPLAEIATPVATQTWSVGDAIAFSGSAIDPEEGPLPAASLSWSVILHHCSAPGDCHEHPLAEFPGVASGEIAAPDHEVPSHLELRLTATDAFGLQHTASVTVEPAVVQLSIDTAPSGLPVTAGTVTATTPFVRDVIVGSETFVNALSPGTLAGDPWYWLSWSNGGAQGQIVVAPPVPFALTAAFDRDSDGDGLLDGVDNCPLIANADQNDADLDAIGDVCDAVCLGDATALTAIAPVHAPPYEWVEVLGTGLGPNAEIWLDGVPAVTLRIVGKLLLQAPTAPEGTLLQVVVVNPEGCRSREIVTLTIDAPPTPGACGLLGIEPFVLLAIVRLVGSARRRWHDREE